MEQELNQEGVTQEQPTEVSAVVSEVTSTEERATSEKTRTEEEHRKLQSMKDKAEASAISYKQSLDSVQSELQELRKFNEQQRLEARRKEITDLEGDTEGQASVRRKHQLQDDVRKLEEQRAKEEGAVQRKYDQAAELAESHNLNLKDARELLKAESPREMELMAQLKATEQVKVQPKVPASGYKPDSGTSDAGGDSDEAFQKGWNAGDLPATKENLARAQKLLNRR